MIMYKDTIMITKLLVDNDILILIINFYTQMLMLCDNIPEE